MTNHYNQLSEAELERLAILAEECAEVIQVVNKIIRHGYADGAPDKPVFVENRKELEKELGDVEYAIQAMKQAGDVSWENISQCAMSKATRIGKWTHHQGHRK